MKSFTKGITGIAGFGLIIFLSFHLDSFYQQVLIPAMKTEIRWLFGDRYHVEFLSLGEWQKDKDRSFLLVVKTGHQQTIGQQPLPADVSFSSSTLVGHAAQHVIIIFTLALSFLLLTNGQRKYTILLSAPLAVVLSMLLDVPLVLVGAIEDLIYFNLAPEQLNNVASVMWMNLMNNGGRHGLAVALGLMCIKVTSSIGSGAIKASQKH